MTPHFSPLFLNLHVPCSQNVRVLVQSEYAVLLIHHIRALNRQDTHQYFSTLVTLDPALGQCPTKLVRRRSEDKLVGPEWDRTVLENCTVHSTTKL